MMKSERGRGNVVVILVVVVVVLLLCKGTSSMKVHPTRKDRDRNRNNNDNNNNNGSSSSSSSSSSESSSSSIDERFCLSWRMGVEANNVVAWRTVPTKCERHVESYILGGQYDEDLDLIMEQILSYVNSTTLSPDGFDAWVLDVDDTCISNAYYYKSKKYGCDPYDPLAFRTWAMKGGCPAISGVLQLFNKLLDKGFKVFLITGRDEQTLAQPTINNLHNQGFIGYERLILRSGEYKGQSAVKYKSDIRRKLEKEGYRIWGNVGDQWSDLQGDSSGNRTFKLPNPMYFVP